MAEKLLSFADEDALYLFNYLGKPIYPVRITEAMPGLCKVAGIPKMEFRELRSACRSNLKAAGVSEIEIMRILGHSNYRTSLIYQDHRTEAQVDAFSRIWEANA
jgi:integrase